MNNMTVAKPRPTSIFPVTAQLHAQGVSSNKVRDRFGLKVPEDPDSSTIKPFLRITGAGA